MRILIDYSQIPAERTGVGNYAFNLVTELSGIDNDNYYYILIQDDDNSLDRLNRKNLKFFKVRHTIFRKLFFRFFLEQVYIPLLVLKFKIDIIHSLHYSFPVIRFKAKRIVNIYDLTFFLFPEVHTILKRIYFRFFIKIAVLLKNRIICISESTLNDLINITGVCRDRCSVILLGKSDNFKPIFNVREIEKIKQKYNIQGNYILYVGTIEPRKNIKSLIYAYGKLTYNKEISLVIAGKKGWYYNDIINLPVRLGINDRIIFTGYIPEAEKPLLINGCKLFIYPSIYEGFGLPVLEAMACGVPVITSGISSMPEITRNSAFLLQNPKDPDEIKKAIELLYKNKKKTDQFRKNGLKRAAEYTWQRTAIKTLKVYNSEIIK